MEEDTIGKKIETKLKSKKKKKKKSIAETIKNEFKKMKQDARNIRKKINSL